MNNCCIITTARYEEQYLDEWINYHLNLGFNHIYICDNNNSGDELNIDNNKVTIVPCNNIDFSKNIYNAQVKCYDLVLNDVWDKHDYCAIIDVDEFLFLKQERTIQDFCKNRILEGSVHILWEVYDDNDLIFHIDKPVMELYSREQSKMQFDYQRNECSWGKSIFKLKQGIKCGPHKPLNIPSCTIDKNVAVVKHYRTKCLEDYIKHKCSKQNANTANFTKQGIIQTYFSFNTVTIDKLLYSIKFCKECNLEIQLQDRLWLLNQFEKYPLLTVVIRTYNRINLLKQTIEELNSQKYKCKILVLNDGSNDGTDEWLATQKHIDYLTLRNNVGPGEILQRGRHLITTLYYIIRDDDDAYKYDYVFEYFYNILIDNPYLDLLHPEYKQVSHCINFVKTQLFLKCPVFSLFNNEDYYLSWIVKNAKYKQSHYFKFYDYKWNSSEVNHVRDVENDAKKLVHMFYEDQNYSEVLNKIKNNYHKYSPRNRIVCDQMLDYIHSLN